LSFSIVLFKNYHGKKISFITFAACPHLDGKHTIFGKVVGGNEVLAKMELAETDEQDKPLVPLKIVTASVFVDPFVKYTEMNEKKELQRVHTSKGRAKLLSEEGTWLKRKSEFVPSEIDEPLVGKYLKLEQKPSQKASFLVEPKNAQESKKPLVGEEAAVVLKTSTFNAW
jgi:peptidyl-prolyl cis-trans isomerase-like protein 2